MSDDTAVFSIAFPKDPTKNRTYTLEGGDEVDALLAQLDESLQGMFRGRVKRVIVTQVEQEYFDKFQIRPGMERIYKNEIFPSGLAQGCSKVGKLHRSSIG